ncbi:MAG TPA: ATP-binding cassette domain-containing protein, partial [Acidimicrobiales bacterium]|nr:ATP-binding cassette domain-containing protein [Acidimicrobiales bacterium]
MATAGPFPSGNPAVEVSDLVVRYGPVVAVDGVSFTAEPGEVLAVLGPNGAGKTTTLETAEGYRRPDGGRVRVMGLDPVAQRARVTPRIGVMLQRGGVYPSLDAADALRLFASYYEDPVPTHELLERVGLADVSTTPWKRLSGGEQQRLSLALALVGRPAVAFLDEPTAGVDPGGRLLVRQAIRDLRDGGTCVVLATHELEEAERLADRVLIVDGGRVAASGTPAQLMATGTEAEIRFGAPAGLDTAGLGAVLGAVVVEERPGEYRALTAATPSAVAGLTAWLAEHDLPLADLRAGRRRLEDVFLSLTGSGSGTDRPLFTGRPQQAISDQESAEARAAAEVEGERGATTAAALRRVAAQSRAEVGMTLRRGESLLVTLGVPVVLLGFFSLVDVLPTDTPDPVDFLAPGILALAVMSTAMVSLGIATGFERQYLVLKRLGSTPLRRGELLAAKTATVLVVEALQVALLVPLALALGWRPDGSAPLAALAILAGTAAFAGLAMLMAGTLRAEMTLAAANGLYLVLLLLG